MVRWTEYMESCAMSADLHQQIDALRSRVAAMEPATAADAADAAAVDAAAGARPAR